MPTFISNTDFLKRYDWRWVAVNVLDGSTATTSATPPTLAQLQDDTSASGSVLKTLIDDASDMVLAAALIGARYSVDDVTTYGGNLLLRIVSGLTVGLILKRRNRATPDQESLSADYAEALEYLENLRQGDRIFYAVPNVPEAGLPATASMSPVVGINPPLITTCAGRYFGSGRPTPGGGCAGGCGT